MRCAFVASVLLCTVVTTTSAHERQSQDMTRSLDDENLLNTPINTSPVVSATCKSDLDSDLDAMVQLTPKISFHWKVNQDVEPPTMTGLLHYDGEGWMGFGLSENGRMIGSTAVIGYPDSGMVSKFGLQDKQVSAIVPLSNAQTLTDTSIIQEGGTTQLRFTKLLDEENDEPVILPAALNTFIFAAGSSNALGYHEHRGSFRVNLETCQSESTTWKHMGLFATHGVMAVLAWGIATPFAMTVAWFRALVPSSWIYIHVFANVMSLVFTFIAVILALSGVAMEDSASHFDHPHHWIGLFLFIIMIFQVTNGFTRPPVERKDAYDPNQYEHDDRIIKLPETPRQRWHLTHQVSGIVMLIMGLYQISSGLHLFAENFNSTSAAPWFWLYVGLFALLLLSLKAWLVLEEHKARRTMEQSMVGINNEQNGASNEEPTLDAAVEELVERRAGEMS
jgi:hypothetical protein